MGKNTKDSKPWDGRFSGETSEVFERFSASVGFDCRLARVDIEGSLAHLQGLAKAGVIDSKEEQTLEKSLEKILAEVEAGTLPLQERLEDIHMNIEARLIEHVGEVGKKLHTGRSRNDQVATDLRLYARAASDELKTAICALQTALVDRAEDEVDTLMPAFTHLQAAQPVSFAHHLLAWFEMLSRDAERLAAARQRINTSPLGSGACSGTAYPIDRDYVAGLLGFEQVSNNSLDAVADRDFAIELNFICTLIMVHLSRMCEEIILWCSQSFGFISLSDAFSTGSSMMPQKRNPDAAELVRGKSARVLGDLVSLLNLMKAQPLAYNRDNQEDKEALFDALDTTLASLVVMAGVISSMQVRRDKMRKALADGFVTATDLADHLVGEGVAFRDAHRIVGEVVQQLETAGKTFEDLDEASAKKLHPQFDQKALDAIALENSVQSKNVLGGTAPQQVKEQLKRARASLR